MDSHLYSTLQYCAWYKGAPLFVRPSFTFSRTRNLTRNRQIKLHKHSMPSTKFVFFWHIRQQRWSPWPLIDWHIFNFSPAATKRNLTKLDRKQVYWTTIAIFRPTSQPRWPLWPLIDRDSEIFYFFSLQLLNGIDETRQEASTKSLLPLCF